MLLHTFAEWCPLLGVIALFMECLWWGVKWGLCLHLYCIALAWGEGYPPSGASGRGGVRTEPPFRQTFFSPVFCIREIMFYLYFAEFLSTRKHPKHSFGLFVYPQVFLSVFFLQMAIPNPAPEGLTRSAEVGAILPEVIKIFGL